MFQSHLVTSLHPSAAFRGKLPVHSICHQRSKRIFSWAGIIRKDNLECNFNPAHHALDNYGAYRTVAAHLPIWDVHQTSWNFGCTNITKKGLAGWHGESRFFCSRVSCTFITYVYSKINMRWYVVWMCHRSSLLCQISHVSIVSLSIAFINIYHHSQLRNVLETHLYNGFVRRPLKPWKRLARWRVRNSLVLEDLGGSPGGDGWSPGGPGGMVFPFRIANFAE